ncbi:unnamed protein product, partial [Polarella glacialis]
DRFLMLTPQYVVLITRTFVTLEGLVDRVDPDFNIFTMAMPITLRRLVSPATPPAREALRQRVLTEDGEVRWQQLEGMLRSPSPAVAAPSASDDEETKEIAGEFRPLEGLLGSSDGWTLRRLAYDLDAGKLLIQSKGTRTQPLSCRSELHSALRLMDEIHYSEFDGRDFDPKEFVQRYRKRIPLPQLQKSLQAHHAATRQELVELINEKYADFVSLSSRMQGVERALKPLRAPLEESCELTKSLHSKLDLLLSKAEETHLALARIRARRDALNTYIENAKLFEKAKASASQRWGNPQESEDFLKEHVAQENVARDLRRIRLNLGCVSRSSDPADASAVANEVEESPECQALLAEAANFQEVFALRLQERLRGLIAATRRSWEDPAAVPATGSESSVAAGGPPPRSELLALAHISRALCTVGHAATVEAIFSDVFVKPVLKDATTACNSASEEAKRQAMAHTGGDGGAKVVGAGAVDLGVFFHSTRVALLAEDAPLLWLSRRLQGDSGSGSEGDDDTLLAVPSLRLVAKAVVFPILKHVQEVWPNVFMPAFPDIFATNYTHYTEFVQAAEAFIPPAERDGLRRHAFLGDFQRRWKTQVYCSLRAKEATQRLEMTSKRLMGPSAEVTTSSGSIKRHPAGGHEYWMEVSAEMVRTVETAWSNQWYLNSLYPKMAQLSLELLARYHRIMQGLAESLSATGPSGWDAAASPPSWAPSSIPVHLSRAASDMLQVLSALEINTEPAGHLAQLFLGRLPGGGTPGSKPVLLTKALLQEAAEGLRPALRAVEAAMLTHVVAAMVPQFAAIRGIPAFYRMLNKPVPTKASPYVDSALRPLQAFREVAHGAGLAPAAVGCWLQEVVDGAAADFCVQATQLLDSTHQQEASLRRLAGRSVSGEAQVSDLDKIHIQLCLDVDTFSSAVSALGASAASATGLMKLAEVVLPVRRVPSSQ